MTDAESVDTALTIASVGSNVTSYADQSLAAGMTYTYRVRARGSNGTSDYLAEASATIPYRRSIHVRVTDTEAGEEKRYVNPAGNAAHAITDTDAFAACQ